ncbi:MAG TPA: hypothetical protein VK585_01205 [Jiangellaceae bacterium]|nr:hypothetical protein [Jiangellaceae bacterium]
MRQHRVIAVVAGSLILAACAATSSGESDARRLPNVPRPAPTTTPSQTPTPTPPAELPRGGRTIFPEHRLVGFSGGRGESFGLLGIGDMDERAAEIAKVAAAYTLDGRTPLPVFELIAVIAHGKPTDSGLYRTHEPAEVVEQYLAAARRHRGLTWNRLTGDLAPHVYTGFKLFYDEDQRRGPLMSEAEVLALRPQPSYVLYE